MNLNNKIILDASALLALLYEEQGFETVHRMIENAIVSTVNITEVIAVLVRDGLSNEVANQSISGLKVKAIPFTYPMSLQAGYLIAQTRKFGLSLGDRACLALGIEYEIPVLTADKAWTNVSEICGVDIQLIR